MTFIELGMVGIGGFLGAVFRYLISEKLNVVKGIPFGTFAVNLVGAFLIGIIFGMDLSRMWLLFFASGLAGALTTFSTLNKEIIDLWRDGKKIEMVLYMIVTYCGGLVVTIIGYFLSTSFS